MKVSVSAAIVLLVTACAPAAPAAPAATQIFAGSVVIGVSVQESGAQAGFGKPLVQGAKLAAEDINARGGVVVGGKSYRVEIETRDNRSEPTTAVVVATELAQLPNVTAVYLGDVGFDASYDIFRKENIIVLGSGGASAIPLLRNPDAHPLLINQPPLLSDLMIGWLGQIRELAPTAQRIAFLVEDIPTGHFFAEFTQRAAPSLAMQVVAVEFFPLGTTDFSAHLTRLKAQQPDLLFAGFSPRNNVPIIQQAAQLEVSPLAWSPTGVLPADLGALARLGRTTVVLTQAGPVFGPDVTFPQYEAASKEWLARLTEPPRSPGTIVHSYYSLWMLKLAMEKAGSLRDGAAIAAAMKRVTFEGPFGAAALSRSNAIDKPVQLFLIRNGEITSYLYAKPSETKPMASLRPSTQR